MTIREQIEYGFVASALKLCQILPENAVYSLFQGFGRMVYLLSGRRRRLSFRNVEIAFPEKTRAERRALIRRTYRNLSESMAFNALVMTGRISNERILSMVETEGWEKATLPADENSPGFLVISGHLGNWELLPQYAALRLKTPLHVIAREGNNRLIENGIIRPMRKRFGVRIFYKKNALMRIMKSLNRGNVCGLMIDQKLSATQGGVPIQFFGHTAFATGSPALLQIRFGIKVQPAFMIRVARNQYRLIIENPVEWIDNKKTREEQVVELTQLHQHRLEAMIRRYPDQWFWMHNRWNLPKVK